MSESLRPWWEGVDYSDEVDLSGEDDWDFYEGEDSDNEEEEY